MSAGVRYTGPIASLAPEARVALHSRTATASDALRAATGDIIARVREQGDAALLAMARAFDGVTLTALRVPDRVLRRALDGLPRGIRAALERAAANIAAVHRAFMPASLVTRPVPGIIVGRRVDPLDRVGVYAPGGRASYPSSVLMGVIPARIAGVREVVLASPPSATGLPPDITLAAAALAQVDAVFAIGGAGAIAAMAFGTRSVPAVDRIVGPGNAWVSEAKAQLSGVVGIDCPAGPSELLVIADASTEPERVALELIAQAEHDPLACVVAVALSQETAANILAALGRLVPASPRRTIVAQALATRGAVVTASDMDDAVRFANGFAPEHLLLAIADAGAVLSRVRNAGTVFVGDATSVVFGDYITGANHVLPTAGTARWHSGLSPLDFVRFTTWQQVDVAAAREIAADAALLADAEGLPGHAAAALASTMTEAST